MVDAFVCAPEQSRRVGAWAERAWRERSLWVDRREVGAISRHTYSLFGDTLEGGWRVVEHPTQGGELAS